MHQIEQERDTFKTDIATVTQQLKACENKAASSGDWIVQLNGKLQACLDEKAEDAQGATLKSEKLLIHLNKKIAAADDARVRAEQERDDAIKKVTKA